MNGSIIKLHIYTLIMGLLSSLLFVGHLQAGEMHNDISSQLKQIDTILTNQIFEEVFEDQAIINGQAYLITSQTHFTITDQHKHTRTIKNKDISGITFPCLATITYRSYSIYTEGKPFHGDKVLLSVVIKHAIPGNKLRHRRSLQK